MPLTNAPAASTHGHTILRWLAAQPMSAESLRQKVNAELGDAVSFHTCDVGDLSLDALLALLAERGKLAFTGEVWTADLSKMCADH